VRTLANRIPVILKRRNRSEALLLSQLGDAIEREGHGPAGTKRIENLLKTPDWPAAEVGTYLVEQAKDLIAWEAARVSEKRALCILDGSVAEKPESEQLEGLAPINSAKARRLRRPRSKLGTGYSRGPGGPLTVVPGFSWLGLLVTGWAERAAKRSVALVASFLLSAGGAEPSSAPGSGGRDSHRRSGYRGACPDRRWEPTSSVSWGPGTWQYPLVNLPHRAADRLRRALEGRQSPASRGCSLAQSSSPFRHPTAPGRTSRLEAHADAPLPPEAQNR